MGRLPDIQVVQLGLNEGRSFPDPVHLQVEQLIARGITAHRLHPDNRPTLDHIPNLTSGFNNTPIRLGSKVGSLQRCMSVNTVYRVMPLVYGGDQSLVKSNGNKSQRQANDEKKRVNSVRRAAIFQKQLVELGRASTSYEHGQPDANIPNEMQPKLLEDYFTEQFQKFSSFSPPKYGKDEKNRKLRFLFSMMEKFERLQPGQALHLYYLIIDRQLRLEALFKRIGFDVDNIPGDVLKQCFPHHAGITSSYTFVALHASAFFCHLEDSVGADSFSLMLSPSGWKIWIVVPAYHADKLIRAVREWVKQHGMADFFPSQCYNFLQHKELFLHTKFLDIHGIDYTLFVQSSGIYVTVGASAIHWGIAYGRSLAFSTNLALFDYFLFYRMIPVRFGCLCENTVGFTPNPQEMTLIWETHVRQMADCEKLKAILPNTWREHLLCNFPATGDKPIWKTSAIILIQNLKKEKRNEKRKLERALGGLERDAKLSLLTQRLSSPHYPIVSSTVSLALKHIGEFGGETLFALFARNGIHRGVYKLLRPVILSGDPTPQQVKVYLYTAIQCRKKGDFMSAWKQHGKDGELYTFISEQKSLFPEFFTALALEQREYEPLADFVFDYGAVYASASELAGQDAVALRDALTNRGVDQQKISALFGFPFETFRLEWKWGKEAYSVGHTKHRDNPPQPLAQPSPHGAKPRNGRNGAFTCLCNRRYKQKAHLTRHILSKNGQLSYQCPYCPLVLVRKEIYMAHVRNVHNGQVYICSLCGLEYKSRAGLYRHNASVHKKK